MPALLPLANRTAILMKPYRIATALFILVLFAGSGASCQIRDTTISNRPKPTTHMLHADTKSLQQEAETLLGLSNEQYYSLTQADILQLQDSLDELYELNPEETADDQANSSIPKVLAIGMPGEIDKSEKKELPVLVGIMQSGQRQWETELFQNLWFILREANSGKVMLSRPFLWDKRAAIPPPSKSGNPPTLTLARANSAGVSRINVIKDLFPNSSWKPGMYYLTAVYYDWVSNSKAVELTNLDRKYTSEIPDLDARLQHFEKLSLPVSEAAPISPGLSISMEGPVCKLALRLRSDDALFTTHNGADYFLCTILLFKLDANSPDKINLALPVKFLKIDGANVFETSVSLDLSKANSDLPLVGSYMTYLVSGQIFSGPYPIHF
ncbi:MAG: hypothetical protein JST06_01105 [Bacteroidetes bacterium]|nr:hypothetical protein [Bacteroidota bacterium]